VVSEKEVWSPLHSYSIKKWTRFFTAQVLEKQARKLGGKMVRSDKKTHQFT